MNIDTLRRTAWAGAKLTGAACLILAIGWAFLTMNPDPQEPVQQAEADIGDFDFLGPKSKQERFIQTLVDEGMEKPRSYDWNGNKFFFSMTQTRERPMRVMRRLQKAFVRNGVNAREHTSLPPSFNQANVDPLDLENASPEERKRAFRIALANKERLDDFFSGGVVPIHIDQDYVAMAGTTSKNRAEDSLAFMRERILNRQSVDDTVGAMRFVDAKYDNNSGLTTVTATWSDEDLSIDKLRGERDVLDVATDTDIPACIGCERLMRFAGEEGESKYVANAFIGSSSVEQVVAFYDRALRTRGWELSPATMMMERMMRSGTIPDRTGVLRSYARGPEFITLLVYHDELEGRTVAQLVESP